MHAGVGSTRTNQWTWIGPSIVGPSAEAGIGKGESMTTHHAIHDDTAAAAGAASTRSNSPARHDTGGRTHGLPFVFWVLELGIGKLLLMSGALAFAIAFAAGGDWRHGLGSWLAVPVVCVVFPLLYLVYRSHRQAGAAGDWSPYLSFRDPKRGARWRGKKIPMEIAYEAYLEGELESKLDLRELMQRRTQLFRFAFTWGDAKFFFRRFLVQNFSHSRAADRADVKPVYDRGNDFYEWFLGDSMVYTSGIFRSPEESLEVAQRRKLDTICQSIQLQAGDRLLDIGCGWGTLVVHAAAEYGAHCTGVSLAREQIRAAEARAEAAGVSHRVTLLTDDYRNLPSARYDKITCVEMAEHVGIKNFQSFLLRVKNMLEDDGVFYLQIAGLRRAWQYEDFVWGLFMAKYIFPGADASCPLGFVVSQAERAGFEVHRVENCGTHYALTIEKWYENWQRNEQAVVEKYGRRWFRLWSLFLAWSRMIGAQGSSALFMLTLTKNLEHDQATVAPGEHVALCRSERWIGPNPVATQQ
jgi:cyclopropane fatty-acyl-phospholipid synthase-like methyltransferase